MSAIPAKFANPLVQRLPATCSLSQTSLEQCALRMAPVRIYTLHVSRELEVFACMLVRHMGADTRDHPFAPFINIRVLDILQSTAWFIQGAVGEAWGSEGL